MTTRKPKGKGRNTVITPQVIETLVEALKAGATHEIACQYAGIGKTAFYQRLSKDAEFAEIIGNAEGRGAIRHLANINKLALGTDELAPDWKASAWILERRYPEMYGRRVVDNNIRGDKDAPLRIEVVYASDEDGDDNAS